MYHHMRCFSLRRLVPVCVVLATGCGQGIYKPDYERGYLEGQAFANARYEELRERKDIFCKLMAINEYRAEVRRRKADVASGAPAYSYSLGKLKGLESRPVE